MWSYTPYQWLPTTHESAGELNSILALTAVKLFCAHNWTVHTLAQITVKLSMQPCWYPSFDNPMSQLGSLCLLQFLLCIPYTGYWGACTSFFLISPFGLRTNPKLSLKSRNHSLCASLLHGKLDTLLFMQFSPMHMLFFHHGIPDCLGVLLIFYIPPKGCHLRVHWLTSGLGNTDGLNWRAFLCDHLAQTGNGCIKICDILFWLHSDSIDCCLQLSAFDSLEKVADFCATVYSTVAIISKALHYCMLFFVKCDILVPNPAL